MAGVIDKNGRYSRHELLKSIGKSGQEAICAARVLVIGAGGIGCPAALSLVESGVGSLCIVDSDTVDVSNLPRQILHTPQRVGMNKAESAKAALSVINPDVPVAAVACWADDELLDTLVAECDLVLDGCDNFRTRHVVNRAAVRHSKKLVSASAVGFSGQIAVFDFADENCGCYQCLFPEDEEEDVKASQIGVFAPVTGAVGMMAAGEAMKLLAGIRTSVGKLSVLDFMTLSTSSMKFCRDPECSVCNSEK